jgi:hypothetical protein
MPATDEDVVRDLLHRYTAHVHPPVSIAVGVLARQRCRDRRRKVTSLAAAGAALGTAVGVFAAAGGHQTSATGGPGAAGRRWPAIRLTADQRVLYRLSSVAARQPQGQGRYAVMSTEGDDVKDTSVIDSLTGNMWSFQQGSDGSPSGKSFSAGYSPTSAQFAAMPTGLAALRVALIAQWDSQHKSAFAPLRSRASGTGAIPVPRPVTVSDDDKVFQQASDMLWNPLVSPALRAALYKVLAAVPGVEVNPSATDGTGRLATEISRVDSSGFPGGKSDGITYATYDNPATGAVLESTITYPPGSDIVTPQDPRGTSTVVDTTVYLGISWASSVPADPYGG